MEPAGLGEGAAAGREFWAESDMGGSAWEWRDFTLEEVRRGAELVGGSRLDGDLDKKGQQKGEGKGATFEGEDA
jgi:hypothetical protein